MQFSYKYFIIITFILFPCKKNIERLLIKEDHNIIKGKKKAKKEGRDKAVKKICAFGDSVLKGIVLDHTGKYKVTKNSFSNLCENAFEIKVDNWGKFGSTIRNGEVSLERYYDKIKGHDYVLFEFGGNDCDFNWKEIAKEPDKLYEPNSTIKDFELAYTELINKVKSLGVAPVLLSLPPIDAKRHFNTISKGLNADNILKWMDGNVEFINHWHERYNLEVFKLGIEQKISVIDITSVFLEQKNYRDFICEDGIHPNDKGHEIIAKAITNHIEQKFQSVDTWKQL